MQKEIGTYLINDSISDELNSLFNENSVAARFSEGPTTWHGVTTLKDIIHKYEEQADHYIVGWAESGDLAIHFMNDNTPVAYGEIRMLTAKGKKFYEAHVGKDMFLSMIVTELMNNNVYTYIPREKDKKERRNKKKEEDGIVNEQSEENGSV